MPTGARGFASNTKPGAPPSHRAVEEVFVLGHEHRSVCRCVTPDYGIVRGVQLKIENMLGFLSLSHEPAGEGSRKLVVHQEFHAAASTG